MNRHTPPESFKTAYFQWDDPFLIDDQLDEDERMIRDSAQAFAVDVLAPIVENAYLNEETDPSLFRKMGEAGLLGVTIPEEYGGSGATMWRTVWLPARLNGWIPATAR
jgi:glutaryl-CoA dehydrogenase